jgi:hypothetical protein
MFKKICIILFLLSFQPVVFAGNFSYTYLGVDIGKATLDEEFIFDGYLYDELGYASIHGSYQFNDYVVLSIESSSMGNEGGDTEITYSYAEFILSSPIVIGENVDIVPFIGSGYYEVEACISNICGKNDESSVEYGIKLRVWLVPNSVELNVKYLDADSDEFESELGFGVAYMINKNNRINVNHRTDDSISLISIGYRYNW